MKGTFNFRIKRPDRLASLLDYELSTNSVIIGRSRESERSFNTYFFNYQRVCEVFEISEKDYNDNVLEIVRIPSPSNGYSPVLFFLNDRPVLGFAFKKAYDVPSTFERFFDSFAFRFEKGVASVTEVKPNDIKDRVYPVFILDPSRMRKLWYDGFHEDCYKVYLYSTALDKLTNSMCYNPTPVNAGEVYQKLVAKDIHGEGYSYVYQEGVGTGDFSHYEVWSVHRSPNDYDNSVVQIIVVDNYNVMHNEDDPFASVSNNTAKPSNPLSALKSFMRGNKPSNPLPTGVPNSLADDSFPTSDTSNGFVNDSFPTSDTPNRLADDPLSALDSLVSGKSGASNRLPDNPLPNLIAPNRLADEPIPSSSGNEVLISNLKAAIDAVIQNKESLTVEERRSIKRLSNQLYGAIEKDSTTDLF